MSGFTPYDGLACGFACTFGGGGLTSGFFSAALMTRFLTGFLSSDDSSSDEDDDEDSEEDEDELNSMTGRFFATSFLLFAFFAGTCFYAYFVSCCTLGCGGSGYAFTGRKSDSYC